MATPTPEQQADLDRVAADTNELMTRLEPIIIRFVTEDYDRQIGWALALRVMFQCAIESIAINKGLDVAYVAEATARLYEMIPITKRLHCPAANMPDAKA